MAKEKSKKLGSAKNTFFVSDSNDRLFVEEDFHLELKPFEKKEVTKAQAELLKEKYPYLTVEVV